MNILDEVRSGGCRHVRLVCLSECLSCDCSPGKRPGNDLAFELVFSPITDKEMTL